MSQDVEIKNPQTVIDEAWINARAIANASKETIMENIVKYLDPIVEEEVAMQILDEATDDKEEKEEKDDKEKEKKDKEKEKKDKEKEGKKEDKKEKEKEKEKEEPKKKPSKKEDEEDGDEDEEDETEPEEASDDELTDEDLGDLNFDDDIEGADHDEEEGDEDEEHEEGGELDGLDDAIDSDDTGDDDLNFLDDEDFDFNLGPDDTNIGVDLEGAEDGSEEDGDDVVDIDVGGGDGDADGDDRRHKHFRFKKHGHMNPMKEPQEDEILNEWNDLNIDDEIDDYDGFGYEGPEEDEDMEGDFDSGIHDDEFMHEPEEEDIEIFDEALDENSKKEEAIVEELYEYFDVGKNSKKKKPTNNRKLIAQIRQLQQENMAFRKANKVLTESIKDETLFMKKASMAKNILETYFPKPTKELRDTIYLQFDKAKTLQEAKKVAQGLVKHIEKKRTALQKNLEVASGEKSVIKEEAKPKTSANNEHKKLVKKIAESVRENTLLGDIPMIHDNNPLKETQVQVLKEHFDKFM